MLKPVKRRGSPFWIARGTINGKRIETSTKCRDYTKAKRECIRIAAEIADGKADTVQAVYTFTDAMNDYIEAGGEARYLDKLKAHFGDTPLDEIDNRAMVFARNRLYPNAQNATINRQLYTPVSAIIRNAARDGLCSAKEFKRPKSDNPRTVFMTPDQAERLILESTFCRNGYFPALLTFLIGQGCRLGETLQIDMWRKSDPNP